MKREGLYEKMASIANFYPNECELNEYNHPELKQKFGCYSTRIAFKRNDNYVDINFYGLFPYYLDYRNVYYIVRVLDSGKIMHNISWKDMNLLDEIVSYIENELYNNVEEQKKKIARAEREKRIKEMNRDPHIDKYREMSKEILFGLGHTYRTDSLCDDNEPVTEACEYKGYGLVVIAKDLPGYVYVDEKTGGLQSFIKKYMNNIEISYNGSKVFDSKSEIYKKGIWEDILIELYNKLDILINQKDNKFKEKQHCLELLKDVILPLYYKRVSNVNNSLRVHYYTEESERINNCGSRETDYHYRVIKNGKEVFHTVETSWDNFTIYTYIPGSWENELRNYLVELDIKRQEKDNNDGLEYIRQLRKLK